MKIKKRLHIFRLFPNGLNFSLTVTEKCLTTPNIPHNGALACDYWLGGKLCQMFCKEGYDVQIGKNTVEILVCVESGKWLPAGSLPLPDCASE